MSEINWDGMFADAGIKSIDEPTVKQTKPKPNWNSIFGAINNKNVSYNYDKGLLYILARMLIDVDADNDIIEYYIMNAAYVYNDLYLEKLSSNSEITQDMQWKMLTTVSPFPNNYKHKWPKIKSKQVKKDRTIEILKELFPERQHADLEVLHDFITSKDIKQYQKERGDIC